MPTSDNSMLAVYLPIVRPHHSPPCHPFRFEAIWLQDSRCDAVVQETWMMLGHM